MNIFEEIERKQVRHFCQNPKCKTNYCKKTADRRCTFCGKDSLLVLDKEGGE